VERVYHHSTRLLGSAIAVLGVAMVVTTLARGGGPLALGVVLGALFAVLGCARVYLAGPRRARQ
jgi:drug/metabolite transporter (DMT)-like permease